MEHRKEESMAKQKCKSPQTAGGNRKIRSSAQGTKRGWRLPSTGKIAERFKSEPVQKSRFDRWQTESLHAQIRYVTDQLQTTCSSGLDSWCPKSQLVRMNQ